MPHYLHLDITLHGRYIATAHIPLHHGQTLTDSQLTAWICSHYPTLVNQPYLIHPILPL